MAAQILSGSRNIDRYPTMDITALGEMLFIVRMLRILHVDVYVRVMAKIAVMRDREI